MAALLGLPELGVGFIYWPSLDEVLEAAQHLVDVIEVEPQAFWFTPESSTSPYRLDRRAFDRLRGLVQPKLVHGVGFPIGGTVGPGPREVRTFVESIEVLGARWASEHLSFNRVGTAAAEVDVGFLLPPVQTAAGVAVAAANIVAIQRRLPVPFAFETGVNYLQPRKGELSDGTFFAAVAREADCGILLDLHNVWANERNGRQPVHELVDELPLERVVELHLAGGADHDGYWVDAHSDLIPPAVLDLARWVVPQLPNLKAIIYEVMPEYVAVNDISTAQLTAQFRELRTLWEMRGSAVSSGAGRRPRTAPAPRADGAALALPTPREWEEGLAAAVTRTQRSAPDQLGQLGKDPGTHVLRSLIGAARAGTIADTLTLTTRLLLLTIGEQGLRDVFDDFWTSAPSERMASDEAQRFAAHVTGGALGATVGHLYDVLAFELAAHQAVITGEPQHLTLQCDPQPLLSALREGRLPPQVAPGHFEVTVSPPTPNPCDMPPESNLRSELAITRKALGKPQESEWENTAATPAPASGSANPKSCLASRSGSRPRRTTS